MNSNAETSPVEFMDDESTTGTESGNLVVTPRSKAGSGTCFPAPNSYARLRTSPVPIEFSFLCECEGVASGVGGNLRFKVSILVFSQKLVLGVSSLDSAVAVTLTLAVLVIVKVCRCGLDAFEHLIGDGSRDCSSLISEKFCVFESKGDAGGDGRE